MADPRVLAFFISGQIFRSDLPILHHDIQYSPSKFLLFLPPSLYSRLLPTISFSLSVSFPMLPSYQKCNSCYGQCILVKHFFGLFGIVSFLGTVGCNNLKGMIFSVIISLEFSLNLNSKICTWYRLQKYLMIDTSLMHIQTKVNFIFSR